jgi:allophanate hydrolase subunit 1
MHAHTPKFPSRPLRQNAAARGNWRWVSERALRVETGDVTLAWYATLLRLSFAEIEDLVPADGSLLIVLRVGAEPSPALLAGLAEAPDTLPAHGGGSHEIVVAYGGLAGPDLLEVAARVGLDVDAYVQVHAAGEYAVAFLGFQPGFPYLTGLPAALHAPRRKRPRIRVPAGSVAVGGTYTGIYPAEGPGGWQIIGRARTALFESGRQRPALMAPGDRVRFVRA